MIKINFRIEEAVYARLVRRAHGANMSLSAFVRSVLAQAADPNRDYIYSAQDEILATQIQILSILATAVGERSAATLERGMTEARALLLERGLLPEESAR